MRGQVLIPYTGYAAGNQVFPHRKIKYIKQLFVPLSEEDRYHEKEWGTKHIFPKWLESERSGIFLDFLWLLIKRIYGYLC